jgi:hypothetical protein
VITALLIAVAVAGQVNDDYFKTRDDVPAPARTMKKHRPIDREFVPKVGDIGLLGVWNRDTPEKTIDRAWCYGTLDCAREAYSRLGETEDDGVVSGEPDGYIPRAGTGLVIVAFEVMRIEREGVEQKAIVLKVRLLEGEFKDREFYTAWHSVYRYSDTRVGKKAKADRKSGAK